MKTNEYYRRMLVETQRRGLARFLFEKEGEEAEPEETAEEETAEEEEPTEEAAAETETADATEETGDETSEETEEEETVEPDRDSIDNKLEAEFAKAEEAAVESFKSKSSDLSSQNESMQRSKRAKKLKYLYEAPKSNKSIIDIEHFANSVARLVYNYDTLLDIEGLIVQRAVDYISNNYDEEVADKFKRALQDLHDIDVSSPNAPPNSKLGVPNAVGARQATA